MNEAASLARSPARPAFSPVMRPRSSRVRRSSWMEGTSRERLRSQACIVRGAGACGQDSELRAPRAGAMQMNPRLDADSRRLLDAANFAYISTLMADGAPRVEPVWIGREGDRVLITTDRKSLKSIN